MSVIYRYGLENSYSLLNSLIQEISITSELPSFHGKLEEIRHLVACIECSVPCSSPSVVGRSLSPRSSTKNPQSGTVSSDQDTEIKHRRKVVKADYSRINNVTNLPNSLLLLVFTFLHRSSYQGARRVCKNWLNTLKSPLAGELLNHLPPSIFRIGAETPFEEDSFLLHATDQNLFSMSSSPGSLVVYSKDLSSNFYLLRGDHIIPSASSGQYVVATEKDKIVILSSGGDELYQWPLPESLFNNSAILIHKDEIFIETKKNWAVYSLKGLKMRTLPSHRASSSSSSSRPSSSSNCGGSLATINEHGIFVLVQSEDGVLCIQVLHPDNGQIMDTWRLCSEGSNFPKIETPFLFLSFQDSLLLVDLEKIIVISMEGKFLFSYPINHGKLCHTTDLDVTCNGEQIFLLFDRQLKVLTYN